MIYRWQDYIGIMIVSMVFGVAIGIRTKSISIGLLTSWAMISAVLTFLDPDIVSSLLGFRLKIASARSFVVIMCTVWFVSYLNQRCFEYLVVLMEITAIVNCGLLFIKGYGLLNANSADATMIALTYPLMLVRAKKMKSYLGFLYAVLPIATLLTSVSGATSVFVLGSQAFIYLCFTRVRVLILPVMIIIFGIGYYLNGETLYTSTERTREWAVLMSWWAENTNPFFGAGSGTFIWLGPYIQNRDHNLFIWMHSDWLQFAFEQGLIGFSLSIAALVTIIKRAWNRPWLLASIGSYAVAMVPQFPLRFFITQILALCLIRIAIDGEDET